MWSEDARENAKLRMRQIIEATPDIQILEFEDAGAPYKIFKKINETPNYEANPEFTLEDTVEWITEVLTSEKVFGEFLFLFEDRMNLPRVPTPWMKVVLGGSYQWVAPLWKRGEGLYFLSLNLDYFLEILWVETRFRAYVTTK